MYAVGNTETETVFRNELCWYAVVSRSRHEKLAAAALTNTGITAFLPVIGRIVHERRMPILFSLNPRAGEGRFATFLAVAD